MLGPSRSDPMLPSGDLDVNEPKYGRYVSSVQEDADPLSYFNVPFRYGASPTLIPNTHPTAKSKHDGSMRHQPSLPSMPEHAFSAPLPSGGTTPRPVDRQSVSSGFGVDPPRPPRDGKSFFKWRNRSTKSASESDVRDTSFTSPLTSLSSPPNFRTFEPVQSRPPSSPFVSESAHVFSLQHPATTRLPDKLFDSSSISPTMSSSVDSISPMSAAETVQRTSARTSTAPSSPPSSEGLYGKAKKSIGSRLGIKSRKEQPPFPSIPECERNCSTMDGTGNYSSVHQVTKTGTWQKDDKSKLRRRLFGRAPWVRKESGESYSSVASSVREILKGETPPPSPYSSYAPSLQVDCVDNQYPGGEAVRIKTPPLAEDTANGQARSFFTETVAPSEDDHTIFHHCSSSRKDSLQTVRRQSVTPQACEWWEKIPKKPIHRNPFQEPIAFEFQIPEHLPNSPMCPANPKHVSGGTGVLRAQQKLTGPEE
ncbi:hypothetical protein F66182_8345 [Fusarium sp. NRRL 66182]|nr:hypothetical protein F66182_8345 [Fusarium sp. NRRL 66182]